MRYIDRWSFSLITVAALGCAGKIDNSSLFTSESSRESPSAATGNRASTAGQWSPPGAGTQDAGPTRITGTSGMNASTGARADAGQATSTRSASGGSASKADAPAECNFRELMQSKCGNANCHGAPASSTGLDLTSASLAMRVNGRTGTGACRDRLMIDHETPAQSALYLKVSGDSCGLPMPPGASLTPTEQDCVLSWIEGLPPPNQQDAGPPPMGERGLDASTPAPTDAGPGNASQPTGGSQSPVTPSPDPACDFRGLMQAKCAGASCHGGPNNSTGLDLTSASLAARVDGRTSNGACSGDLLIDKDNPAQSVLYVKVIGSGCGTRMPIGGTLTAEEQACVLSWIEGL